MSLFTPQKFIVLATQHPGGKHELIQALATLSKQEIIVLIHLADDPTAAELADTMHITPKSAANYKDRITAKLQLTGCRALRRFAIQHRDLLHFLKKEALL